MADEIKERTVYVLTRKNKADDDDSDIYVGSTSRTLEQRFVVHRSDAIRSGNENNRLYKRMREIGLGNWEILPLLAWVCGIKEIREVERKWIKILNAGLNSYLPVREEETVEEYQAAYYEKNKDAIKAYRESKKDVIKEYQAAYYGKNKDAKKAYYEKKQRH